MNLVIDVGNTVTKAGLFDGEKMVLKGTFSTFSFREPDEWGIMLVNWLKVSSRKGCVEKVVVCSVVQNALSAIKKAIPRYFKISPVEFKATLVEVPILCDNPQEVGADRIANVLAVRKMYQMPAVVVDFGTATTFDVVSEEGAYIGGVIAPGIRGAAESLWEKAEKLFPVEIKKPSRVIGKNTAENLTSGIFYTFVGMVREIVERIEKEIGREVYVVATGGFGRIIGSECEKVKTVNPDLTLQGLNFFALEYKNS
ncbi:type III pantothenate kinase [Candidatus Aerophobetes bacterium]|nr:type III pantothenate kinase [Candidatus Aerophobetes bacterium]